MKANQTSTATSTRTRLVVLFALLVLSGVKMSAQTQSVIVAPATIETVSVASAQSTAAAASTLNFVSWFMGTKQNTNVIPSAEVSESNKKQMINSGIAPNRLLIKAFLKRASNYTSTVA